MVINRLNDVDPCGFVSWKRVTYLASENSRLDNHDDKHDKDDNGNYDNDNGDEEQKEEEDKVASSRCSIVMNYRCVAENREQRDASRADEVAIGGGGPVQLRGISRCTFLSHGYSLRDDEYRW